jgi:hypothetical protein
MYEEDGHDKQPVRWGQVMMAVTLISALAAPAAWIISQNATNSNKLDNLSASFQEIKATIYTKVEARADQKSQEMFNNMLDIRLRVIEEDRKRGKP